MTTTPLSNFLTSLADPVNLTTFEADPRRYCESSGLTSDLVAAVLQMRGGLMRVLAMRELERAGLSPTVTDKFPWRPEAGDQVGSPEINIYPENTTTTNNFPDVHTIDYNHWPTTSTVEYNESITTTNIASDPRAAPLASQIMDSLDTAIAASVQREFKGPGRLMIVGSGIRSLVDLTLGAEAQIRVADRVFYTVADPVTEKRIHDLNPNAVSLYDLYGNDKPRIETYREMVAKMLDAVYAGEHVCGVFYGHPGVFAWPTHEAIRQARRAGYRAEMMPGVSADACLFADLGIDPSHVGYQTFEATEMLINQRKIDNGSHVVIWQVECVGEAGFNFSGYRRHNFGTLIEYVQGFYTDDHPVVIYEASMYPHLRSIIKKSSLSTISKDDLTGISTLYIPPMKSPTVNLDMIRRLGLN